MKNKKNLALIIAIVILSVMVLFASCNKKEPIEEETTTTETTTQAPLPEDINPLTGLTGLSKDAQGKRPYAVVVENSPAARPQWGLCTPDIVVEGLVEGGITRMLWLYSDIAPLEKAGPNRSARNNYVEVAEGFDAIYVHLGGSSHAYKLMNNDSTIDHIDGLKTDGYFSRDRSRGVAIEHTAYTKGEWLLKATADKKIRTDIKEEYKNPFKFASSKRTPANACNSALITFSSSYKHTFEYNSEDGLYYNIMNTKPMTDENGKQMSVENVIVIYCNVTYYDTKYAEWNLTKGKGLLITNGGYEEITWEKGKTHDMLKLYSSDGNELELNTGKSWIGFVPEKNVVEFK